MPVRCVWVVIGAVLAAHWVLIFGPFAGQVSVPNFAPSAPQRLEAMWVDPVPALPAPTPAPTPAPSLAAPIQPSLPTANTPPAPRKAKVARMPAMAQDVVTQTAMVQPVDAAQPTEESMLVGSGSAPVEPPLLSEQTTTAPPTEVAENAHTQATPHTETIPVGPQLLVRNAQHMPVALHISTDGTALSQHQHQQLHYRVHGFVKGMQYHASAQLQWSLHDGQYQAQQTISAFLLGSMEQTSQGAWTAQGLQPLDFSDRRFAKRRSVHFEWSAQQAHFTPERPAAPIGAGAQDRLSVFLQLAAMLQSMPVLREPGTRIDIPTLGSRSLQMWTFVVEHTETLELAHGAENTLRLQRLPLAGDSAHGQLWLSPALGFLPARIRLQESNGDEMELVLKP